MKKAVLGSFFAGAAILVGGFFALNFFSAAALPTSPKVLGENTALAVPTGLASVCGTSGNSVTLSWNAVSGATSYLVRINDQSNDSAAAQDGWYVAGSNDLMIEIAPTTYTYGIKSGQQYGWWVHAYNSMGWSGATQVYFTCVASSKTADTAAPSVPQNLQASAVSQTQINLTWSASTDNVAVTGYKIYRGGVKIIDSNTPTTYSDTGLTAGTPYSYTVAAYDAAGNISVQSAAAATATPGGGGSGILLGRIQIASTSLFVRDKAASVTCSSEQAVSGFVISYAGPTSGTVKAENCNPEPFYIVGLPIGTYTLTLTMPAGWASAASPAYQVEIRSNDYTHQWFSVVQSTPAPTVPAAPANLQSSCNTTGNQVSVSWNSVTGATSYLLRIDDLSNNSALAQDGWYVGGSTDFMTEISPTSYTHNIIAGRASYRFWVHAKNSAGFGDPSISRNFTCGAAAIADTTPPSAPQNLVATAVSSSQINLAWTASTDNVAVAGYKIYRGGSQIIASNTPNSYSDTGLTAGTAYSYTVVAYDAAGNTSAQSAAASATTQTVVASPGMLLGRVAISGTTQYIRDPSGSVCTSEQVVEGFAINYSGSSSGSAKVNLCNPEPFYATNLAPGTYTVSLTMPTGWQIVGTNQQSVTITSSQQTHQWFSVYQSAAPAPTVTGITFNPSTVVQGGAYSATFSGTGIDVSTWFDVLYTIPGSAVENEYLNWQKGITNTQTVAATGTPPGVYTIIAARPHLDQNAHSGVYQRFTSPGLNVVAAVTTPTTGTIQGFKLTSGAQAGARAGEIVSLDGGSAQTANPYSFQNVPVGSHTVSVTVPSGWSVGYTLCYNRTDCHNNPPTPGNSAFVIVSMGEYADLWWHFTQNQATVNSNFQVTLGEEQYVMGPSDKFIDAPFYTIPVAGGVRAYSSDTTFFGSSLDTLQMEGTAISKGNTGNFDECGVWLSPVYKLDENHWIGWYYAEQKCNYTTGVVVGSIAFVESFDAGKTWTKTGYPNNQVITANVAFNGNSDKDDAGGPKVIKAGDYFYMFFLATEDWQVHLARSKVSDLGKPGTWYKYYNGGYTEPGIGGKSSPIKNLIGLGQGSIVYSDFLKRYISVQASGRYGFYVSASNGDDLTSWQTYQTVYPLVSNVEDASVDLWWADRTNASLVYAYASFIAPSGNSERVDKEFYLYYMKVFSKEDFDKRYLMRRKITLDSADKFSSKVELTRYAKTGPAKTKVSSEIARPTEGYKKVSALGYLLTYAKDGFQPLYECYIPGSSDYFDSTADPGARSWRHCESDGDTLIRNIGWASKTQTQDANTPLYRCFDQLNSDHFVTNDANCEGKTNEGILGYSLNGPGSTTGSPPVNAVTTVTIRATGTPAAGQYPVMQLKIGSSTLGTWTVSGQTQDYTYSSQNALAAQNLRVVFTNDYFDSRTGEDRNLTAEQITVNGTVYASNAPTVYVSGLWSPGFGCQSGYLQTKTLYCQNGYFEYPTAAAVAIVPPVPVVANTYYVSPSGSDNNPGTIALPFATIAKARDVVRAAAASMTSDITVYLRGGTHTLSQTLTFDQNDSGNGGHNIIYKNYPGEKPMISGGRVITGWVQEGSKWKANVGMALQTRQLYVNGIRAVRARSAAGLQGEIETTTGYITTDLSMQNWGNIRDIELVANKEWKQFRCGIASISGGNITMRQPCWANAQSHEGITMDAVSWIENAYQLLDSPGEWYLNRATGWLYYMPRPGENMATAEVVAPVLETLVSAQGTADSPVRNLKFEGLIFAHGTWLAPNGDDGFADIQASFHNYGTGGIASGPRRPIPANVRFRFAREIVVERSVFTHLGGAGLSFETGSQNNLVRGNVFTDVSSNGLDLGDIDQPKTTDDRQITKNNQITNNYIKTAAAEYQGSVGIWLGYVQNTTVAHNELTKLPYTGISVGWGWGESDPTVARDNKVQNNLITDWTGPMKDGGGIYSLSAQPGNDYSGNVVSNLPGLTGLYLDIKSRYINVHDNVSVGNLIGIWATGGDHTIRDNWWTNNTGQYINFIASGIFGPSTVQNNTVITSLGQAPASILQNAGLDSAYQDIRSQ